MKGSLLISTSARLMMATHRSGILAHLRANLEPHPEEPPRTPEGNRIALAAVERMAGMIPISDPELARWLAESPEASIWGT